MLYQILVTVGSGAGDCFQISSIVIRFDTETKAEIAMKQLSEADGKNGTYYTVVPLFEKGEVL